MSLYVSPQTIPLVPGASAKFTLVSTTASLGTVTFTPTVTGQFTFAKISGDNTVQLWSVTATADAYTTQSIAVTDTTSGETIPLLVSVAPATPTVPSGYTATSLVYMVRLRANEPNLPTDSDIITLANAVVEQAQLEIGGIRLVGTYPTAANQIVQALTADTQEILSCSFSTGPPNAPGSLVYPMTIFDQESFMDFAGGFPAVGFGPPVAAFLFQDNANVLQMQLYPAAVVGQLNVYYTARPALWNLNTNNVTNMDTSFQEAVVVGTIGSVLDARGRSDEAKDMWWPRYTALVDAYKAKNARRTQPKGGQVRDVTGRGYPALWFSR